MFAVVPPWTFKMAHPYGVVVFAQTLHPVSITCPLSADQIVSQEIHPLTSSVVHWFRSRCFGFFFSNQIFYYYRNFTGTRGGRTYACISPVPWCTPGKYYLVHIRDVFSVL